MIDVPKYDTAALHCGRYTFDFSRPRVMGILNVTPDSFSDGGRYLDLGHALEQAHALRADGADLIDVGGESSRPGATEVPEGVELQRVLPLVERLVAADIPVSVDTAKQGVMRAALAAGASMINDIRALRDPDALATVAASDAAVCLMHLKGEPRTMQQAPRYDDVVTEVRGFLVERANACITAGIGRERILIDPGFGFGKTLAHNLALLHALSEFVALGYPVLSGWSRKSSLGTLTGRPAGERLAASVAAALAAVAQGALWVRVHDVRETVDALTVWRAAVLGAVPNQST